MSRDLFGEVVEDHDDKGETALGLVLFGESPSGRAWLLGQTDSEADAQWVPKSQVRRGEGRDENIWTMPVWLARDRGWL